MAPARPLSLKASKLLIQLFRLCWLAPVKVAEDERIVRAIYSPFHVDKHDRLKHQAYHPTPKTDEISVMRLEYMGATLCRRKARSFENPAKKKEYSGFAVLRAATVCSHGMQIVDSRRYFCGHADIRLMMEELANRESDEPLSPEVGKRLKDLKERLVKASTFISDPHPRACNLKSHQFLSKIEGQVNLVGDERPVGTELPS
ncbi:MAG: hypothetical protein WAN12_15430 [Candidatus Acidiferrum sp.]